MSVRLEQDFRPAPQYREFYVIYVDNMRAGKLYVMPKGNKLFMSVSINVAQQGKGVGKEAVAQFMRMTRVRTVFAVTRKGNLPMNRILRKLGWREVRGERQAVYRWSRA